MLHQGELKMAGHMLDIPDLGEKINLLLKYAVNDIHSAAILAKKSEISPDYISRFRSGQRRISSNNLKKLCKAYPEISESLWCESLNVFAQELGLGEEKAKPAFPAMVGIDFESRIRDRRLLEKTFETIKGYWEYYRYAISHRNYKHDIIFNLLEIIALNDNDYFECILIENDFYYKGYCFQGVGGLFFMLEETSLINGTIFLITNIPNTHTDPEINGVFIGLTGGPYSLTPIPSATRVALRHINSIEQLKEKYAVTGNYSSLIKLSDKIQEIINSDTSQLKSILDAIDNHIPLDAVPYALRAKSF